MKTTERNVERITSDRITELRPGEIFVFGSNLEGAHGGGAALLAWRKWGAKWGQGVGLQGQTYGIPTMHGGPEAIRPYVDEFICFAADHPELHFWLRRSVAVLPDLRRKRLLRCFVMR